MFQTNPNLRADRENISITKAQMHEIIKCSQDISYFANTYYKIISLDHGKINIPLRDYQYKILKSYIEGAAAGKSGKRNRIVLSGRQTGKTTVSAIYVLWYILFNKDKTVGILGNKAATAMEIMSRVREAYEDLPIWMQPGLREWNKTSFETSNGIKVFCSATSASGIRGKSVNLILLDEFSFIPKNLANDFMASVMPTVSSGNTTQVLIVSTPSGTNHFYDMWQAAKLGKSSYMPIRVNWWNVPGRDLKWKEQMIADIGLVKFNAEYACQFLGSSNTLVSASSVEKHLIKNVIDPIEFKYDKFFEVYEKPNKNKRYALGVDPSKGLGQDFSVIQVLDVTDPKRVVQVAMYRNNMIDPIKFAQIVQQVSIAYNDAKAIIENNNEMGGQLIQWLWYELEFEGLVSFKESKKTKREKGIRATRKSKFKACMNIRDFVDNDWITLRSKKTCEELLDFEEVSENIFRSASGHDDTVAALYWGLYFIFSNAFEVEEFSKFDSENKIDPLWKNEEVSENSFGRFGLT